MESRKLRWFYCSFLSPILQGFLLRENGKAVYVQRRLESAVTALIDVTVVELYRMNPNSQLWLSTTLCTNWEGMAILESPMFDSRWCSSSPDTNGASRGYLILGFCTFVPRPRYHPQHWTSRTSIDHSIQVGYHHDRQHIPTVQPDNYTCSFQHILHLRQTISDHSH